MKNIVVLFLFAFGLVTVVQAQDTETRRVGTFDEMKVSHGIKVVLVAGNDGEITLYGRHTDLDDIYTEVERGTLRIKFRNSRVWNWDDRRFHNRDIRVEVPFEGLYNIEVNTGAMVISESIIHSEDLRLEVTTGGEADLEIEAKRFVVEIAMGAVVEVSGRVGTFRVKANMGAEGDFRHLESDYVYAKSNMGAELRVKAVKEIDASAGMGGMIFVYGSPEKRYTSHGFGGEIIFERIN